GGSAGFDDVKVGQWYTDYINWAASKKIITGTGNGKFGTENPISRQDMAVIMERFAKEMKISLYAKANKVTFADDSKIAPYAKDAVYTMQQAGIINGTGGNNFNPTGNATRGETAKMITMVIEAMLQ
ncbi:MAG: S-layer homology domain-containing protein, partial [Anaerovorax sp.]